MRHQTEGRLGPPRIAYASEPRRSAKIGPVWNATDSASCSRVARPRRRVALDGVFQRNEDNKNDEQRRKPEGETASKGQPRGRARRIGVTTTRPHCAKRPFGRVMRARAGRTSSWCPSRQLKPARGSRGIGTGQRPFMTSATSGARTSCRAITGHELIIPCATPHSTS